MEFFIKKNATLPLLKLQVVKDGRSDYDNFMKTIELSALFFSMVDVESGIPKISSRPAGFVEKEFIEPNAEPEYYIYYQFQNRDTNKVGRYEGQFMLRSDDGVLILPIREKLFINVQESFIADDLPYESCYTSEFPCCVNPPYITTTTTTPCPSCPTCPEPTPTPVTTTTTIPEPVTTTTTFPEPVTTTTTLPLSVTLETVITPGSIVIDYILTSNQTYNEEISMEFTHMLGTNTEPITISTGVTISVGEFTGKTQIILADDYNLLTKEDSFGDIVVSPQNLYWVIYEDYPTPTPTPNPTPTPTPTPNPLVPLTININPTQGIIMFNGTPYSNTTTIDVELNTLYSISGIPAMGYYFAGWSSYGVIIGGGIGSNVASVLLSSGASINAVFGSNIPTPTPTETMAPTPTETMTPTPTQSPCGVNQYQIYLTYSTNTSGPFINDLLLACNSLSCLNSSTCYGSGAISAWFNNPNPQVGDSVYSSCNASSPSNVNGYYISNINSVYTLYEFSNGIIISNPSCI